MINRDAMYSYLNVVISEQILVEMRVRCDILAYSQPWLPQQDIGVPACSQLYEIGD